MRRPRAGSNWKSGCDEESGVSRPYLDQQFCFSIRSLVLSHLDLVERSNQGIRFLQLRLRKRTGGRDDFHFSGMSRANTRRCVFDHEALFWLGPQQFRTFEIRLRIRLTLGYVVGRDHYARGRQIGNTQPSSSQQASAGSDDTPAAVRDGAQQVCRAGHDNYAVSVLDFQALYLSHFGFGIQVWGDLADGFNGAPAVCGSDNRVRLQIVFLGPFAPLTVYRAGGID